MFDEKWEFSDQILLNSEGENMKNEQFFTVLDMVFHFIFMIITYLDVTSLKDLFYLSFRTFLELKPIGMVLGKEDRREE